VVAATSSHCDAVTAQDHNMSCAWVPLKHGVEHSETRALYVRRRRAAARILRAHLTRVSTRIECCVLAECFVSRVRAWIATDLMKSLRTGDPIRGGGLPDVPVVVDDVTSIETQAARDSCVRCAADFSLHRHNRRISSSQRDVLDPACLHLHFSHHAS